MKPRTDYKDKLEGAIHELISAQSALNMEPEPIKDPKNVFLCDKDKWASHAYDHILAATELIISYKKES